MVSALIWRISRFFGLSGSPVKTRFRLAPQWMSRSSICVRGSVRTVAPMTTLLQEPLDSRPEEDRTTRESGVMHAFQEDASPDQVPDRPRLVRNALRQLLDRQVFLAEGWSH